MSSRSIEQPVALVRRAFAWWVSELGTLVPAAVRRPFERGRPRVVLALETDGARVLGDGVARTGTLPLPDAARVAATTAAALRSEVELRLPHGSVFTRHVPVPPVGNAEIDRILQIDLGRATPFRATDVYTTWLLDPAAAKSAPMAHQLVVKRSAVDPALAELSRVGIQPTRVGCWDATGLAPAAADFMREPPPPPLLRWIPAAALALTVSAVAIAAERQSRALEQLQAETASARTAAAAVRRSIDDAAGVVEQADTLRRIKDRDSLALPLLADLTAVLPDTAHVTDLRIEGRTVEMSGIAAGAARLPQIMEASGRFGDVALVAPLTTEGRDRERFSIRARYQPQESGQ